MKTEFFCNYELKDLTAIDDSTPTTAYNQPFGDLSRLKTGAPFQDYGTLEQDYFLLDGSMEEFPDAPEGICYFSSALSGADGAFAQNPLIHVLFTHAHSSIGLKFYFLGDPPLEVWVRWYDAEGLLCGSEKFAVDSAVYFARKQVEDYYKLELEFTRARPYRYVKLYWMEYGTDILFGRDVSIQSASIVEELDPVSNKLPVNKLTYKAIDTEHDFNFGNPDGLHKVFQRGQHMRPYETVDGARLPLGDYYLDSQETDGVLTSITAVDRKGLLDNGTFRGGRVYAGERAGPVIESILSSAGIADYEMEESVYNTPLHGWLKIQSCRKALREVLFAAGAVADTCRTDRLRIYIPDRKVAMAIDRSRKFSTSVSQEEYISDVSVKFPAYTLNADRKQIAKGEYSPGSYTLDFSSPVSALEITGGVIIEQTPNYVCFTVDQAGEVVIFGRKYDKEDLTVTASVERLKAGEQRNAKSFTSALMDQGQAREAAGRLLDYHSLRLSIKTKFLNEGDRPGQWAEVGNPDRQYGSFAAGLEKMTTDLAGGFLSTAELRGYYKELTDWYYAGEIYAGEVMT